MRLDTELDTERPQVARSVCRKKGQHRGSRRATPTEGPGLAGTGADARGGHPARPPGPVHVTGRPALSPQPRARPRDETPSVPPGSVPMSLLASPPFEIPCSFCAYLLLNLLGVTLAGCKRTRAHGAAVLGPLCSAPRQTSLRHHELDPLHPPLPPALPHPLVTAELPSWWLLVPSSLYVPRTSEVPCLLIS